MHPSRSTVCTQLVALKHHCVDWKAAAVAGVETVARIVAQNVDPGVVEVPGYSELEGLCHFRS